MGLNLAMATIMLGRWTRVLCCWGVAVVAVQAAAIEFIPKEQAKVLADEFAGAHIPTQTEIKRFSGLELECDMYGMRSRLQVERNVRLYMFSANLNTWKNQGAQVVTDYKLEAKGLIGRSGSMVDELRVDKTNRVIAQLSLVGVESNGKTTTTILAYSKCKNTSMVADGG